MGVFCGLVCLANVDTEKLEREFDAHQSDQSQESTNSNNNSDVEKGPFIPTAPYIPPITPIVESKPIQNVKPTAIDDVQFDMID